MESETVWNEKLITLGAEAETWEEAIRISVQPMLDHGYILPSYVEAIIDGVGKFGPYIVLAPHIAIPHARPETGALKNGLGVCVLKEPVTFGSPGNDPVRYLFPLCASGDDGHIALLQKLALKLDNPAFYTLLDNAKTAREILDYLKEE